MRNGERIEVVFVTTMALLGTGACLDVAVNHMDGIQRAVPILGWVVISVALWFAMGAVFVVLLIIDDILERRGGRLRVLEGFTNWLRLRSALRRFYAALRDGSARWGESPDLAPTLARVLGFDSHDMPYTIVIKRKSGETPTVIITKVEAPDAK